MNDSFWILFIIITVGFFLFAIAFIAAVTSSYSEISNLKARLTHMEINFPLNTSQFLITGEIPSNFTSIMESNHSLSSLETTIHMIEANVQIILNNQKFSYFILNEPYKTIITIPFASSCKDIFTCHRSLPSGYYWLILSNGSSIKIYCEMKMACDGITGGWMRVAKLNKLNNGSAQCF